MEFDGYFALFLFVFMFASTFIFAAFRLSIFTILFFVTMSYLNYLALSDKITTKELFKMSLIPVGFMLAPIILIIHVVGVPFSMLLAEGISEAMQTRPRMPMRI